MNITTIRYGAALGLAVASMLLSAGCANRAPITKATPAEESQTTADSSVAAPQEEPDPVEVQNAALNPLWGPNPSPEELEALKRRREAPQFRSQSQPEPAREEPAR